jgi:hypothetical protein
MIDTKEEVCEARQRADTCYKCGEAGHTIRNCPRQALVVIGIEAAARDEIDDAADQAARYAAHCALMTTDYALLAPEEVNFNTATSKSVF